jgi:hypothetical protein
MFWSTFSAKKMATFLKNNVAIIFVERAQTKERKCQPPPQKN